MTVIATIHQPSGDIFNLFDRLMVLQDGYTLYQGPVKQISNYFRDLSVSSGKYQNPADTIIKLAQVPELCNMDLSFDILKQYYETKQKETISRQIIHIE